MNGDSSSPYNGEYFSTEVRASNYNSEKENDSCSVSNKHTRGKQRIDQSDKRDSNVWVEL